MQGVKPAYPVGATPVSPLGPGTPRPGQETRITSSSIGCLREVDMIAVSTTRNSPLFYSECLVDVCMYQVYGSYIYLIIGRIFWARISCGCLAIAYQFDRRWFEVRSIQPCLLAYALRFSPEFSFILQISPRI